MSEEATRSFQFELDFDASPDEVWRALTEPRELERWFPFEARVEPRLGGEVLWSWGGAWTWLTRIDGWEPGRRLRLAMVAAHAAEVPGLAESLREAAVGLQLELQTRLLPREELADALGALLARYHDQRAPGGRPYRLTALVHPVPAPAAAPAAPEVSR